LVFSWVNLRRSTSRSWGPKAGRAAFKSEFADMMAATTGGASPYDNFLMSHYVNVTNKAGERLPERAYEMPFQSVAGFASGNMEQAQKYLDQGNAHWPATTRSGTTSHRPTLATRTQAPSMSR
jgi:hypothetical protein